LLILLEELKHQLEPAEKLQVSDKLKAVAVSKQAGRDELTICRKHRQNK